jgi:flagellar basal body P-ring formation protein FlgA
MTDFSFASAKRFLPWLLLSLLLGPMQHKAHADNQSHDAIYQAARDHLLRQARDLTAEPKIEFGPLDQRLALAQCSKPLEAFDPPSFRRIGRTSVGVRCTGEPNWSLFLSANIIADLPVVVASHNLAMGSVLQASDLRIERISSDQLNQGYLSSLDQVVGKRLRRDLSQGKSLNNGMLLIPKAVQYGNLVTLVNGTGGLEVRMRGKALGHGSIGDRIAVLNLSSKRKVDGIIRSPDTIEVP